MSKSRTAAICVAVAMMAVAAVSGQAQQTSDAPSRVDLFAGYSYWSPHGSVNEIPFTADNQGMLFSGAYYFNRWAGLEVEGERHGQTSNNGMSAFTLGPTFRFPSDGTTLFGHLLVGGTRMTGPNAPTIGGSTFQFNPETWGTVITAGGGVDIDTPLFHHHLAIRALQADYQYLHVSYGPVQPTGGGEANVDALRLSSGLVYRLGTVQPPPAISYSCLASPESIYPGDPVTVTGTATNLNPKKTATYSWTGDNGAKVTGDSSNGTVDTASLNPGSYTVTGHVSQGRKPGEFTDCTANFTVKAIEPPTVSCAANPGTVRVGESATITAAGVSPQNRPLTYSYSASAGMISGTGNSATLSTAGAPTGPITVTCVVQDDKGQSATANTTVDVEAPPQPPAVPTVQSLCSVEFDKDARRPARVDNEGKACLDGIALNAQQQPDATLVMVGNAAPAKAGHHGRSAVQLSAQRAVNAKDYLVREKGIDPSRIQVRAGRSGENEVEDYLVPAGATFDNDAHGATPVDEHAVKAQPRRTGKRHSAVPKK